MLIPLLLIGISIISDKYLSLLVSKLNKIWDLHWFWTLLLQLFLEVAILQSWVNYYLHFWGDPSLRSSLFAALSILLIMITFIMSWSFRYSEEALILVCKLIFLPRSFRCIIINFFFFYINWKWSFLCH